MSVNPLDRMASDRGKACGAEFILVGRQGKAFALESIELGGLAAFGWIIVKRQPLSAAC